MSEEPKDPKLNIAIVHCTGEDESFPVSQLVRHTSSTRGWHSMKLCEYPQEIIIRFNGEVRLSNLRILVHETKIPSRIDLSVCRPDRSSSSSSNANNINNNNLNLHDKSNTLAAATTGASNSFPPLNSAVFHRLGYLTFSNNEASGFESRELKTAVVNTRAVYLKLSLRRCHANMSNVFNQVGIVAIGVYGEMLNEYAPVVETEQYAEHLPGSIRESLQLRLRRHSQAAIVDQEEVPLHSLARAASQTNKVVSDSNLDDKNQQQQQPESKNTGGGGDDSSSPLQQQKPSTSTYATAKNLDSSVGKMIDELSNKKTAAVEEENFDEAKRLKIIIDRLRECGTTLADLEERKRRAIEAEDYDVAKALKFQVDDCRKTALTELEIAEHSQPIIPGQQQQHFVTAKTHQATSQQQQQQQHQQRNINPQQDFDDRPVGGGGGGEMNDQQQQQGSSPPLGYAGAGSSNITGNKSHQRSRSNPQDDFDNRPVGAGSTGRTDTFASQQDDSSSSASATTTRISPPRQQQQHTTAFDEKPAVASGGNTNQDDDETGGIVATKKPPVNSNRPGSGPEETTTEWEKALAAMINSELSSGVHPPDPLPTPLPAELVGHTSQFGRFATSCLISKKFQHREATMRVLSSDAAVSMLQTRGQKEPVSVIQQLVSYLGEKSRGVDDGISQAFFAACDALKAVITGGITGVSVDAVQQQISSLIPVLLLRSGDSNQRVREHASATLMLISMSPVGPEKVASALMYDPQQDSKKPLNFRIQSARLSLAAVMVSKVGLSSRSKHTGLTADGVTKKICVPQLTHATSEVREAAVHLIVTLYGLVPQKTMDALLTDIPQAQKSLIDEQLAAAKEDNDNNKNISPEKHNISHTEGGEGESAGDDEELKSTSISVSRPSRIGGANAANNTLAAARAAAANASDDSPTKPSPSSTGKKAPAAPGSKNFGGNKKAMATTPRGKNASSPNNSLTSNKKAPPAPAAKTSSKKVPVPAAASSINNKKEIPTTTPEKPVPPSTMENEEREEKTCQFCARFDPRYSEEALDRHYLRSCPMLCACPLCGQICEISLLQEHLTTECPKQELVRACPNCHEAIRAQDLDQHIAEATCIKHNPTLYNVCPLCHAKTEPFDAGWTKHFASEPGCSNNPRPFDGGDPDDDFKEE